MTQKHNFDGALSDYHDMAADIANLDADTTAVQASIRLLELDRQHYLVKQFALHCLRENTHE